MAAPTLETNGAADTLRITAGTEGNPVTWNDVWDWDDGGGSSGGDGDVPKDGGGFAKVDTFMTETVADAVYLILKDVDFGNGGTPTYFQSKREAVHFADGKMFDIANNTVLEIGELHGDYAIDGSYWKLKLSGDIELFNTTNNALKIYGSYLLTENRVYLKFGFDTIDIRNSIIGGTNPGSFGPGILIRATCNTLILDGVYFCQMVLQLYVAPTTFNNVHFHHPYLGPYARVDGIEIDNCLITDATNYDFGVNISAEGGAFYLINPKVIPSTPWILQDGNEGVVQYPFNIHIRDKDEVNLGTVTCLLEDKDGNEIFSVSTAGDGTITEQTVTYKKWTGTSETLTEYTPHKLTLTKANYETLTIPITMDEDKDLEYKLLPALAVGDVRSGTDFGESKTGTLDLPTDTDVRDAVDYDNANETGVLDLPAIGDVEKDVIFDNTTKTGTFEAPIVGNVKVGIGYGAGGSEYTGVVDLPAIGDVEKGVQFDNTTKTGTFKEPGIANVKEGIQYGASDTEFTGTYVRNVIKIATQLDYNQYNIAIALDSDPSIQITVEDYHI